MMDLYDEDLSENKFFRSLVDKFPNLFDVATCNRCTICVPCVGSLLGYNFSKENIDSHVLVPMEEKPCCFVTVSGKELTIESNIVTRGNGFTHMDPIPVLFEETFFNANDESYMVLCIAQPLDGATSVGESQSKGFLLNSFTDYTTFLWGETGGEKNKKLVDQAISSFLGHLHHLERESLTKHIDAASDLFTKAMQIVLKNRHLKKPAFQDSSLMENVKVAVEAYVLHCVYKPLFAGICSCLAAHDEQLNKITRNLHELQLRDVGVRLEFCRNIPRARKELGYLMSYSTPLSKLNCLKRAVRTLMQPVQRANQAGNPLALTTDDLLPMLIFLVVKMEMPNWWANLTYMTSFHFAKSSNHDEYGFYLACLEAALEHVGAGQMEALMDGVETAQGIQLSVSPGSNTLWKKQELDKSAVDCFFEYVRENNTRQAARMLNNSATLTATMTPTNDPTCLCHPLCTCSKCRPIVGAQERDMERSQVTVNSRDERGFTALHLACTCGHMAMTEMLLERGSCVTATDYHGSTPLHMACLKGHQRLALLLLHYDASVVSSRDNDGNTPLHMATATGHEDCVKAMLYESKMSQLNIVEKNDFGETPLHIAAKWGFLSIAELLLEHGATAETYNRRNLTPLHYAQSNKMTRLLTDFASQQLVLRQQRQQRTRCDSSTSGSSSNHPAVPPVKALPESRTCPNLSTKATRPKSHSSPRTEKSAEERKIDKLLKSVADGDVEMVKFHLGWTSDSDDDDVDLTQRKLCHPLCQCDECQPLQKYYTPSPSGLHVNVRNSAGYSPLHVAAQCGRDVLLELLLRRGADINAKTALHRYSPLHLACKCGMAEAAKRLLKYGAPVDAKDARGKTPFDLSINSGHHQMSDILGQKISGHADTDKTQAIVATKTLPVPGDDGVFMDHFSAVPTRTEVVGGDATKEATRKNARIAATGTGHPDHEVPNHKVSDNDVNDHEVPDHKVNDYKVPDYEVTDHEVPDHNVAEHKVAEHELHDIEVPDHVVHDHEVHDHEVHDHEVPDHEVHDNEGPDHEVPDHEVNDNEISHHEIPDHEVRDHEVPNHEIANHEVPHHEIPDHEVRDHEVPKHEIGDHEVPHHEIPDHEVNDDKVHGNEVRENEIPDHEVSSEENTGSITCRDVNAPTNMGNTSGTLRCDDVTKTSLEDAEGTSNDQERSYEGTGKDDGITLNDDKPLLTDCSDGCSPDLLGDNGGHVIVTQGNDTFSIKRNEQRIETYAEHNTCCRQANEDSRSEPTKEDTILSVGGGGDRKLIADNIGGNAQRVDTGYMQKRADNDVLHSTYDGYVISDAHATENINCIPNQNKVTTKGVAGGALESNSNERQQHTSLSSEIAPETDVSHNNIDQDVVGQTPRNSSIISKCVDADAANDRTGPVTNDVPVEDCITVDDTAYIIPVPHSITSSDETAQEQTLDCAADGLLETQ